MKLSKPVIIGVLLIIIAFTYMAGCDSAAGLGGGEQIRPTANTTNNFERIK